MGKVGGARPGSGRKKGKKLPRTLEREAALEQFRQRGMKIADKVFDKQLSLINGLQFLYRIEKEFIKTGVNRKTGEATGWYRPKKPELVQSEETIRWYLENEVNLANGDVEDTNDPGATFYFLTAEKPNQTSIDSLLNRTFGKPVESIEMSGKDGVPLIVKMISFNGRDNNTV